jgi:hypothetical protein
MQPASLHIEECEAENIYDAGPAGTSQANKLREEYDEAHPIPEWER